MKAFNAGLADLELGRTRDAEARFRRLARDFPLAFEAHQYLARALAARGALAGAAAEFDLALALGPREPAVYFDNKLIEAKSLDHAAVESAAARILRDYPGIAEVFTRTQLENGAAPSGRVAKLVQRAWHRELSGDLYVVQRSHAIFGGGSTGTTHGTP